MIRGFLTTWNASLALGAVLGASFHVMVTLEFWNVPVRASLSDLVLVFAALACAFCLLRGRWTWPRWGMPGVYVWLSLMLAVMAMAYVRGGMLGDMADGWARWKLVGLPILFGYLIVGGWLAQRFDRPAVRAAAQGFAAAGWLSASYGLGQYCTNFFFGVPVTWAPRFAGLAENPNAYGILLVSAFVVQFAWSGRERLFDWRLEFLGAVFVLLAIYLCASRSAYIGLVVAVAGLTLGRCARLREAVYPLAAGGVVFLVVFVAGPRLVTEFQQFGSSGDGTPTVVEEAETPYVLQRSYADHGYTSRLRMSRDAYEMWREQPLLGAGLGVFWRNQQQLHSGQRGHVNHTSGLWLASEMGALGLVTFVGFFLACCLALLRHARQVPVAAAALGVALVMAGASVGTEIIYQRHLWFFVGLGLAALPAWGLAPTRPAGQPKAAA